jgi:hypothetical protein
VWTEEQQKELAHKHTLIAEIQKMKGDGYSETEIRQMLGLPAASLDPNFPTPAGGSYNYGYAYMGLWKEPENQANWCGPGSGKAVISNWRTPPSMWYLASKMIDSDGLTSVNKWISVVNQEIGTTWYEKVYRNNVNVATYKDYLEIDIFWNSHPLNHLVTTKGLYGWGNRAVNHFLAVNRYDFVHNRLTYGDTAPNSANPGGEPDPFGWHTVDIDTFFNNNILDIIW